MRTRMFIVSSLLPLLVACGGGTNANPQDSKPNSPSSSAPNEETAQEPQPVDDAMEMANQMKAAVPEVIEIVEITEDNDANDLIGRPGQYDQAVFLADKRLGCEGPDYDGLGIDCGAKVERWADAEAAQARMDDIQQKLKDFGLGAEWDYVVGRLLVRVAGEMKPSDAKVYEEAARAAMR